MDRGERLIVDRPRRSTPRFGAERGTGRHHLKPRLRACLSEGRCARHVIIPFLDVDWIVIALPAWKQAFDATQALARFASSWDPGMATRRIDGAGRSGMGAMAQAEDGPVTLLVPYTPGPGGLLAPAPRCRAAGAQPTGRGRDRRRASGNIGTQAVARAARDGGTCCCRPSTFVMNPSLSARCPTTRWQLHAERIRISRRPGTGGEPRHRGRECRKPSPPSPGRGRCRAGAGLCEPPGIGTPQDLGMALFGLEASLAERRALSRQRPAIQDLIGRRVAAMVLPCTPPCGLAEASRSGCCDRQPVPAAAPRPCADPGGGRLPASRWISGTGCSARPACRRPGRPPVPR